MNDARLVPILTNAQDNVNLASVMREYDVVINSTWYEFNLIVMEAAIKTGIHYLDLGGLYHMTKKQLRMDKMAKDAGVTCVLGMGSSPGTMNVLAAYVATKMDEIETIKLRSGSRPLTMSDVFQPPFSIRTILDEFTIPPIIMRDGNIQEVPALSGKESFKLPEPVGEVQGYYTIHSELATLPFTLNKGIRNMDFIVAYPSEFTRIIATFAQIGLANKNPINVKSQHVVPRDFLTSLVENLPKPSTPELDVDDQRVEAHGTANGKSVRITVDSVSVPNQKWQIGGGTVGTGTPPSVIAQWLSTRKITKRGVLPPELCVDPKPFFSELDSLGRGISLIENYEET